MADFLDRVALSLFSCYGPDLRDQVVVLPSRRAGLYLARALSRLSEKPIWSPSMITVGELFGSFSSLRPADSETLIFELYSLFRKEFPDLMSFDDFWGWGEVIVSDFSDIDLWMADAGKLYSNISDLKEIDDKFGGLTEEQIEIIRSFWTSFGGGTADSTVRTAWRSVWLKMAPLYDALRDSLASAGVGSEAMICREVATGAVNGSLSLPEGRTWHIAGLNALNSCEKALFSFLQASGRAFFYWDDEHFFMKEENHKAARFMIENRLLFPNRLQPAGDNVTMQGKKHTVMDTPSDTAQARMLPSILPEADAGDSQDPAGTAVILADEKLLLPVLSALPETVTEINVTMGFPFRFTSLYSFIKQILSLVKNSRVSDGSATFRSEDVIGLVRHQYYRLAAGFNHDAIVQEIVKGNMIRIGASMLNERGVPEWITSVPGSGKELPAFMLKLMERVLDATFSAEEGTPSLSGDREYLRMAMAETGKLNNLLIRYDPDLGRETSIRLTDRVFRRLVVPFSGEPLKGIQVMGVLETRALEFKKVIFLSMNEGIFPGQSWDNTFIPYNIRRAFGLPTVNEHESIYSYHFYRLLKKPDAAWFLYNSTAQGLSTGEMSRYLVQMQYSPGFSIDMRSVHITVGRSRIMPVRLKRRAEHDVALASYYTSAEGETRYLSPSAVNTWLNCRMRFYFRYVCGMPEEEKLDADIDQRRFGNILHHALEKLYAPFPQSENACEAARSLASDREAIRQAVMDSAAREMKWSAGTVLTGRGLIISEVLERYISDVLGYDAGVSGLAVLSLEQHYSGICQISGPGGEIAVRLGGRADRVDMTGGAVRVVDYKTGSPKGDAVRLEDLFNEEKEKRNDAYMQALVYCSLIRKSHPGRTVIPAVYWVQQISSEEFSPYARLKGIEGQDASMSDWEALMKVFDEGLTSTVSRIFSPEEDFVMTPFEQRCNQCPYRMLCRR